MEIIFEANRAGSQLWGFMENSTLACCPGLLRIFVSQSLVKWSRALLWMRGKSIWA